MLAGQSRQTRYAPPPPTASMMTSSGPPSPGSDQASMAAPATFFMLLLTYVVWATIEQHNRVNDLVRPQNIAFNVRNFLQVTFTVLLGFLFLKVLFVKLSAMHVPGAAYVLQIVSAA